MSASDVGSGGALCALSGLPLEAEGSREGGWLYREVTVSDLPGVTPVDGSEWTVHGDEIGDLDIFGRGHLLVWGCLGWILTEVLPKAQQLCWKMLCKLPCMTLIGRAKVQTRLVISAIIADFLGMVETCRNCGPQHF